jgi:hypothetical protein
VLGGCTISDNVVCDTFFEALAYMNAVIEDNVNAYGVSGLGRCWSFVAWSRRRSLCRTASGGD